MSLQLIKFNQNFTLSSTKGTKGLNWISSFLTNRTHHVVVNGSTSNVENVLSGVPQGTVDLLVCKNRATMHVHSPSFAVNDTVIGEVAKVKYIGHVIANDMTDDADMMRQRCQLYALGNVLSRLH